MNQQTLQGRWKEIKGKIAEKWGDLTDDDLQQAKGNSEQLIGLIERKTGESRDAINRFLDSIINDDRFGATVETAQNYAAAATESVQETAQQVMDSAKEQYVQTERMVRQHPLESLAVCFGVGIVTGLVGGLLLRSK